MTTDEKSLDLRRRMDQPVRIFDTTLSAISDFAYIFDREGRFLYANKPLLDLWGLTLDDAVGKNFFDLHYPEELAKRLQDQIQQVFTTRQRLTDETPYTSPTGAGGYYEYIFAPVIGADGAVEVVAGSTRDITERKRTEEKLRDTQARLERLVRNLEDFAHIVSHDLKAPLNKIVSYGDLLKREAGPSLTGKSALFLEQIMVSASRMRQLISSLLTYSKATTTVEGLSPVDMNTVVDQVLADLETPIGQTPPTIKKGPLPILPARSIQMRQLIQNLVDNAVKHSDKNPVAVEIAASLEPEGWMFRVTDNGIGIDSKYLVRIFDLFQRGESTKEGSGVGLTICRKIVESHGGRIWAASEPGIGTTVWFTIPKG